MKRVLCILSCMNAGGAETFLMKIYRQLDRTKYQMDFCVNIFEEGFYDEEITQMGGRIFRIPAKSDNLKEFKKQLSAIIKSEQYETVLRITSNTMGFLDLKIAKKAGAKICAARSSNSNDPAGIKARIAHRLGRILYGKYVDVKIAPSDLAAIYTFGKKNYLQGKVNILHNGLKLFEYAFNPANRTAIRNEFGISEETSVIGHIGRFQQQKNHEFLIDVFYEYLKSNDNSILMLVGVGDLENQIREKVKELNIENNVIFTGLRQDVPALLSAFDTFVFPSIYEGMPNTVIEAQASGLNCLISDTITKEANITGTVSYISLNMKPGYWANNISLSNVQMRPMATEKMKSYDIDEVTDEFIRLMYEG